MNFATLQTGGFADEDLVKDGWTDISQRIRDRVIADMGEAGSTAPFGPEAFLRAYEESDDEKMTEIRARVDAVVADAETAEALKPWYRQLCKRPCFHDEYLQAYNEPGAHLVDTDGKGVERIDETGVWVGGVHYELDCLIFASGFEVGTDYARRAGFETAGRGGLTLSEHWADGMQTLHGIHVHGFPNLFIVGPNQGANLISNITHNLVEAGTHHRRRGRPRARGRRRARSRSPQRPSRPGSSLSRATSVVPRQPRLHPGLLQQRGPAHRPPRAAQHERLPGRARRLLPLHRRVADLGRVHRARFT